MDDAAYISVITRPGSDQVFGSLEEMLSDAFGPRGISRARILSSSSRGQRTSPVVAPEIMEGIRLATSAIHDDPLISAALEGLNDPSSVSLGTFLDRVRGTANAQTRRQATQWAFVLRRGYMDASRR